MDFLAGSFRVGRLFRIDIRVHILFVVFLVSNLAQSNSVREELMFTGMLFGIILLHELGHCFGARSVGGDAETILMWPLGGLAFAHAPMRPWPQFVTVACGPLVNVALCLLSGVVISYYYEGVGWFNWNPLGPLGYAGGPEWLNMVYLFYRVNYWLLAFNLLPVYPMDGGQLLHTLLWPFMGLQRSLMLTCQIGLGGALVLGFWALQSRAPILFFIALMGAFTCWQRYTMARHGMVFEDPDYRVRPRRSRKVAAPKAGGPVTDIPARARGPSVNPNPGAWEDRLEQERALDSELDRILRKVHENGISSLTYVERQTLERATRARQERERKLQQQEKM